MHRFKRYVVLSAAAAWVALAVVTDAQVFRSSVEYVRLDVVVTDKQDRPVSGLTKDDFLISESGRAQAISTFEAVTIPTVRREITDARTTTPSIDVVSNSAPPLGRQWVMVIDDLHIIEHNERKLRAMVTEFLQRIPADDQVAIVFVGRSDLSQGFTNDMGAQMRTVNRLRDALGQAYDAYNSNGMNPGSGGGGAIKARTLPPKDVGDAAGATIDSNQSERHRYGQATIDVLNNVSRTLASSRYPRKALVYVSEGPTYDLNGTFSNNEYDFNREAEFARDYFNEIDKSFAIARKAGVPVYTIDPRGLADGTATRSGPPENPAQFRAIQRQANNMRAIAENTGGLAFVGMSDMPRAVEALIHDNDIYYLVGFYPEPLVRDGKFHDVAVKIKGRDDVRVRARAGYSAPSAVVVPALDLDAQFNQAMVAALPESGIALRVLAAPIAPSGRLMKTAVALQVTYPAEAGKLSDTLDYAIAAIDLDGKVKVSARKKYEFSATPKSSGDVTFVINEVIEVPSQPLQLRVGVASRHLGKIGVIHTALEVPKPNSDNTELGGVVLGYAGPAREDAKPKGALEGLIPFQPTTDRTFTSSDSLQVFAPVFWKPSGTSRPTMAPRSNLPVPVAIGAGSGAGPGAVNVMLSIRQGAKVIVERRDQVEPETTADRSQASFMATLPLKALSPGAYILTISANAGGSTAKREVAFVVR